ncbi:A1pp-domain-containing protein [Saccharata proteae CBS 121410]|uniref:A1pp-domain-containing protein n=1 Tax=Saccharata proteae CBS 121410 TaxID=1314787 RepID=A0A6A5YDD7_9PEZI|nr:A1pp-domain-containing protein [Saccharata proteae CBS 121410]
MAPLIALKDIPTLTTLYATGKLPVTSGSTPLHPPNPTYNDKIALIRHDITKLHVDAIVNAANTSLLGGGGVDGAIHSAAGPGLLDECETLNGCATGDAKITDGYELLAKKVIHAVGPVYARAKREGMHETLLRGCYRKSLDLAVGNGCRSVAFSALSTGVYGYPSREAAEAATGEVRKWLDEDGERAGRVDRIVFCNFLPKDEDAYVGVLP